MKESILAVIAVLVAALVVAAYVYSIAQPAIDQVIQALS
jgi:hypothetical protein